MNNEYLDSLTPEEIAATLARCRDTVRLSEGFAIYGGQSRREILNEYNFVRLYVISQLTIARE